ncbi:biotin synthesis protein BioC [Rickettsiales bacterium]|nr:biotin synthesis protein BioC [Rickettsiales bacterium]
MAQRAFDKAAESYDDFAAVQRKISYKLCSMISNERNDPVLDIGCGTGYVFNNLSSGPFGLQLDLAFKMCRLASRNNSAATIAANAENLPIMDDYFGLITSSMALQWVPDLSRAFREMHRVLRSGGLVYISIPLPGTFVELDKAFHSITGGRHVHDFASETEVKMLISAAGFAEINIEQERITEIYPNFSTLLQTIKKTGTGFKSYSKLFTLKTLKKIESLYAEKYRATDGIKLSWIIAYIAARKM